MSILEKIIAAKQIEVATRKAQISIANLTSGQLFETKCYSLVQSLQATGSSGVIAEFKRKSPSKGLFSASAKSSVICPGYQKAGAAGISILTDHEFFGGELADIEEARPLVSLPILRKDFVIDEYQIIEAKGIGADVVLLIAAALSVQACQRLSLFAKSLGLEVLLEVHNKEELFDFVNDEVDLLGVNNRNLKTFETNIELSKELADLIPAKFAKVAESGLNSVQQVKELRDYGYCGFLIGETFMKESDPAKQCADFIGAL